MRKLNNTEAELKNSVAYIKNANYIGRMAFSVNSLG